MKPSIPKGTRDFLPSEVRQRQYIFDTIRDIFELYAYQPIETPVMENLQTLTGKYGEEGDRLLFKVLNNGDFLAKADEGALDSRDSTALVPSISKRGLRYDLTVPFARYVVMHRNDLTMPFKRYQIQPVWRADRPQKGRYQEFYQCDADAIGSESLMLEAEYVLMIDQVFSRLGLDVEILINSRKVLYGIAETAGVTDRFMDMTIAVDKLSKIGWDGVKTDLVKRNFTEAQTQFIEKLFSLSWEDLAGELRGEVGRSGIGEINAVLGYFDPSKLNNRLVLEPTLARGLNYYTGCIFEVRSTEVEMGSLLGGGRYADLTGVFGMPDLSGVGISFGVERIYDVLSELAKFPSDVITQLELLIIAVDEEAHRASFGIASTLREHLVKCEVYPDVAKMKKQMKYANTIQVPYVVMVGMQEANGDLILKDMQSGVQETLGKAALVDKFSQQSSGNS